jgi:hypothetical protein
MAKKEALLQRYYQQLEQDCQQLLAKEADFEQKWQLIAEQTQHYLRTLSPDQLGSKEYKVVLEVYTSLLSRKRSHSLEDLTAQLISLQQLISIE